MESTKPENSQLKPQQWIVYLLIALSPIIVSVFLLRSDFQANLSGFHPAWSDEVLYWQQINSFNRVGFNNGIFSFEEMLADSGNIQYGTHGPVFVVLYGILSRVTGWSTNTGIYLNAFLLFSSLLIFLLLIKPKILQSLLILILVALSYSILYYLPTLMQETCQYSIAILLSGLLIRIGKDNRPNLGFKILALLLVFFASLLRVSWAILFFPVFLMMKEQRTKRWFFFSIVISILFAGLAYLLFSYWTSPYPDWFFQEIMQASTPFSTRFGILLNHSVTNIINFFSFGEPSTTFETIFRYQYLLLMIFMAIILMKKKSVIIGIAEFIMIANFAVVVVLYDVFRFRDYRFLSPVLLTGLLFVISDYHTPSKWFLLVVVIINALTINSFFSIYQTHANEFGKNWDSLGNSYAESLSSIQYVKTENPWCNSLLSPFITGENYQGLAPGIGLNIVMDPARMDESINSHYIFAPQEMIDGWQLTKKCKILYKDNGNVLCEQTMDSCPQSINR